MWFVHAVDYIFFILKILTIAFAVVGIIFVSSKGRISKKVCLEVHSLNKCYRQNKEIIAKKIMSKTDLRKLCAIHQKNKSKDKSRIAHHNVFVIDFLGDVKASETNSLIEKVNAILAVAKKTDEVFIRLKSNGGIVSSYGLATAQLERIRSAGIKLVVAVDLVAASGGYMMASVADKIIASPFAVIGSIGVVAQMPNIHRLLLDKGIDIELHTAGKYKRTLNMFAKNTQSGREKFKLELEYVHSLFKEHINTYRPSVDINRVATGEYWFGKKALELNLVDDLITSDAYLIEKHYAKETNLYQVSYKTKKSKISQIYYTLLNKLEQPWL